MYVCKIKNEHLKKIKLPSQSTHMLIHVHDAGQDLVIPAPNPNTVTNAKLTKSLKQNQMKQTADVLSHPYNMVHMHRRTCIYFIYIRTYMYMFKGLVVKWSGKP